MISDELDNITTVERNTQKPPGFERGRKDEDVNTYVRLPWQSRAADVTSVESHLTPSS